MAHALKLQFDGVSAETAEFLTGLLTRRLNERCAVSVQLEGTGDLRLRFSLEGALGEEGYRISNGGAGELVISSGGPRGWLYGLGKFLRDAVYSQDEIHAGRWRGESRPAKAVRGIYFATHFHNYYHDAPLEQVERYVEELGLWGTNALTVWFDLHHYNSIQDPEAQAMIARLHAILAAARRAGLKAGLLVLGNEAYASSPLELRADWTAGHDGCFKQLAHYHVEVCPSKPGGLDLILNWHREVFEAFADIRLDFVWIWPHDQGGCSCADCAPWGGNGFLRVARPTAQIAREYFPQARLILSTWYFDTMIEGEWKMFDEAIQREPEWVDFIMAEFPGKFPDYILQNGVPAGLPLLGFPEISMFQSAPWGGFGANPLPRYIEAMWQEAGAVLSGGFPYSEGIFEDLNKAIVAWLYWNGGGDPLEAVREYANLEYSSQAVEKIAQAIFLLETSNRRSRLVGKNPEWMSKPEDPAGDEQFIIADPSGVEAAFALLQEIDNSLSAAQRQSWRWRILYLRGLIDLQLSRNQFRTNPRIEEAYEELIRIYSAEEAIWAVRPPALRNRHLAW